jgi:hypothetical protein
MIGQIDRSGVGTPTFPGNIKKENDLWNARAEHNRKMIGQLREDEHATWLHDATIADAALNRMSEPKRIEDYDIGDLLLQPRFAVAQIKPDRSIKLRAVDHFSWCPSGGEKDDSVNGHTAVSEKMCHETLDALSEALRLFVTLTGALPGLIKADIDAAYRRIPVCAKHRWACGIAYALSGQVLERIRYAFDAVFITFEGICLTTFRVPIRSIGVRPRMGKNWCSNRTFGTAFLANRNLALCGRPVWTREAS